jgi:hypothetical protein
MTHAPGPDDLPAAVVGTQDPNEVAVERARLDPPHARWLVEVAGLVDGRLAAVRADWRELPDHEALRAGAFGLLLGLLARRYPQSREVLSQVAEAHPCFGTLPAGRRLSTLEQLAGSGDLTAEWLGPLLGVTDPAPLRPLYAFGGDDEGPAGMAST